ncbi:MAG TPA: hypothetical protein VGF97_16545 [Rhizomicrobium sp.]
MEWFEPASLIVEVSEIVMHEADEPDSVVGLPDADILAGEDGAEIDLALFVADATAGGDGDCLVVERIVELGQAASP